MEQHQDFAIELTRGQIAFVDEYDLSALSAWKWFAWRSNSGAFYAARSIVVNGIRQRVYMHRQILGLTPGDGKYGDHKNGDTLDNRRGNLRTANPSQSAENRISYANTSGFRGVSWCKSKNKWEAQLKQNRKKIHHSRHKSAIDAARAYDAAAKEAFGEFAILNFP